MKRLSFTQKKTEVVPFIAWEDGSEEELLLPIPDGFYMFHYWSQTEGDCVYIVPEKMKCSEEEVGEDFLVPMGKRKLDSCLKLNLTHVYSPMVEELDSRKKHPFETIITNFMLRNKNRAGNFHLQNETTIELDTSCKLFGMVTALLLADSKDGSMITAAGRGGFLRVGSRIYTFQGAISLGKGIAKTASDAYDKACEQMKEIQKWIHKIGKTKGTDRITKKDFKEFFVERMMLELNEDNVGRILAWEEDLPEWAPTISGKSQSEKDEFTEASDSRQKRKSTTSNEMVSKAGAEERSIPSEIRSEAEDKSVDNAASLAEYLEMAEKIEKAIYVAEEACTIAEKAAVKRKVVKKKITERKPPEPEEPIPAKVEKFRPIPVPKRTSVFRAKVGYVVIWIFALLPVLWLVLIAKEAAGFKTLWQILFWIGAILDYYAFIPLIFQNPEEIKNTIEEQKKIPEIIRTNEENEKIYQETLRKNQELYEKALKEYQERVDGYEDLEKQYHEAYLQKCAKRDQEYQEDCENAEANHTLVKNEIGWLKNVHEKAVDVKEKLYATDRVRGYRFAKEYLGSSEDVKSLLSKVKESVSWVEKSTLPVQTKHINVQGKEFDVSARSKLVAVIDYVTGINEEITNFLERENDQNITKTVDSNAESSIESEQSATGTDSESRVEAENSVSDTDLRSDDETENSVADTNSESNVETEKREAGPKLADVFTVGAKVQFGRFPQDKNGREKKPIEWRVMKKEKSRVLLLSEKILSSRPYETKSSGATWGQCALRKWLNGDFFTNAFDEEEQNRIITTTVVEDYIPSPLSRGKMGTKTKDRVFLLSVPEVYDFFPEPESRKCGYTGYAEKVDPEGAKEGWWLRSPGIVGDRSARVNNSDGEIYNLLVTVPFGIRPAMWIEE